MVARKWRAQARHAQEHTYIKEICLLYVDVEKRADKPFARRNISAAALQAACIKGAYVRPALQPGEHTRIANTAIILSQYRP